MHLYKTSVGVFLRERETQSVTLLMVKKTPFSLLALSYGLAPTTTTPPLLAIIGKSLTERRKRKNGRQPSWLCQLRRGGVQGVEPTTAKIACPSLLIVPMGQLVNSYVDSAPVLVFLHNLWGPGTDQEQGCRTGPPGYRHRLAELIP